MLSSDNQGVSVQKDPKNHGLLTNFLAYLILLLRTN